MIIYTDGSNHDDVLAIIAALHSNIPIDAIIITANGWAHAGSSYMIINTLIHELRRPQIPIIMGSLYAHRDYLENHEGGDTLTGKMFNRVIDQRALVEVNTMSGLLPELGLYELPRSRYNENYMEEIIEVLKGLKEIKILSIGAMTDVKYSVEWLIENSRRDDIKEVWQMSAGYASGGRPMNSVTRSYGVDFNIYLDPDAAATCLRLIPDKMIWVEGAATSLPRFRAEDLEPITRRSPMAARISHRYLEKIEQNTFGGIPTDPETGAISAWDLVTFLIMCYPDTIVKEEMVPVVINTDSGVEMSRDDRETTMCYRYNNRLGAMTRDDENGYRTRIITETNPDLIMSKYQEFMKSPQGTLPLPSRISIRPRLEYYLIAIAFLIGVVFIIYRMNRR